MKITTSSLSSGTTGTSYSQTLAASQSQGTLSWSVTAGSLPSGLALNSSTGVISGTPTAAGTSDFTVTATDYLSAPQTFTDSVLLSIAIAQGQSNATPTPTPAPENGPPVGLIGSSGRLGTPIIPTFSASVATTTAVQSTSIPTLAPSTTPASTVAQEMIALYARLLALVQKEVALLEGLK